MASAERFFLAIGYLAFCASCEMDLAVSVYGCAPVRGKQRGCAVFGDDGWTNELVPVTKPFAIVKRNFPISSGKETFREGDRFRARTRADLGNSRQLNSAKNPHGPAANVDDLD